MEPTDKSAARFPIGSGIVLADLGADPYPVFRKLLQHEPVTWVPDLDMWLVVRHADVSRILLDAESFVTVSARSPILATFGRMMLTTEGVEQARYRNAARPAFTPAAIRARLEQRIRANVDRLIDGFMADGAADLKSAFAARLPVLTMLEVFGLPEGDEKKFRRWYDHFEASLSDYQGEPSVRASAAADVAAFGEHISKVLADGKPLAEGSLLGALLHHSGKLSHDEIVRNSLIILFGGISTVEALILNALWSLAQHPDVMARTRSDTALFAQIVEETMRWQAPVQTATRYVTRDVAHGDVVFTAGEVVNCMLGAANRDGAAFPDPDKFDIDRTNVRQHLGFATGPHHCIGLNLARVEARIALERLVVRLQGLRFMKGPPALEGHEFRQPRSLHMRWEP